MNLEISRNSSRRGRMRRIAVFVLAWTLSAAARAPTAYAKDAPAAALAKMVDQASALGARSAFLFDLDETLVDSTPRRFDSIKEALSGFCGVERPPADCAVVGGNRLRLADLYRLRNRYDDHDYLRASGATDPKFIDAVLARASGIYLSGKYLVEEDRLYPGALAFIRALRNAGARVFFSSARIAATQLAPTLEFLSRRGLISVEEKDRVYLRIGNESSVDFKRASAEAIRKRVAAVGGKMLGVFENEPENLTAWNEVFPGAKAFFVEGAYQKDGPIPVGAVLLEDFRY
jgi:hypothetical protein